MKGNKQKNIDSLVIRFYLQGLLLICPFWPSQTKGSYEAGHHQGRSNNGGWGSVGWSSNVINPNEKWNSHDIDPINPIRMDFTGFHIPMKIMKCGYQGYSTMTFGALRLKSQLDHVQVLAAEPAIGSGESQYAKDSVVSKMGHRDFPLTVQVK